MMKRAVGFVAAAACGFFVVNFSGAALAQKDGKPPLAREAVEELNKLLRRYDGAKNLRYDDVAAIAHGGVFLRDGSKVDLTPDLMEQLLDGFIADLSAAPAEADFKNADGGDDAKAQFEDAGKRALDAQALVKEGLGAAKFASVDERLLAKAVVAQALARRNDPASLTRKFAPAVDPLQAERMQRIPSLYEYADRLTYGVQRIAGVGFNQLQPTADRYWRPGLLREILALLRKRYGTDNGYVQQCAAEGVPTPPDWPNAFYWSELQPLDWNLNILALGRNTKVSTYAVNSGPQAGLCIGLPRTEGTTTSTFGIICQSKRTGKACFFDNITADGKISAEENEIALRINDLFNGNNLSENCTSCHRGGNVFLVTPGTPLQHPLGNPDIRYAPVSSQGWANPSMHAEGSTDADGNRRACASCHEIPSVIGGSYCGTVLQGAARRTMPAVAAPVGWPAAAGSYFGTHIAEIRAAGCP